MQWGASLGGPFWKDHTFWFANFEKQKFNIATGNSGTEPNAGYQARGDVLLCTELSALQRTPPLRALIPILWPANLISGTSLSAIQNPAPEFGYSYNGVIKLDHTFNQKHNISGRAFLGQGNQTAPVGQTDVNPWYFEIAPHSRLQLLGGRQLRDFSERSATRSRSASTISTRLSLTPRPDFGDLSRGGIRHRVAIHERSEHQDLRL